MMRMSTDRFGNATRGDEEDEDEHDFQLKTLFTRRFIIWLWFLYITLYVMTFSGPLSMVSVIKQLPPTEGEAKVLCFTTGLQSESGIRAGNLKYGNSESIAINLYTISITRTIICTGLSGNVTLQYKDDYLNISTVDVDEVYRSLSHKYPINEAFDAWYYPDHCYRIRDLDRNCLSNVAADPGEYESLPFNIMIGALTHVTLFSIIVLYVIFHLLIKKNMWRVVNKYKGYFLSKKGSSHV